MRLYCITVCDSIKDPFDAGRNVGDKPTQGKSPALSHCPVDNVNAEQYSRSSDKWLSEESTMSVDDIDSENE